LGVPIYHLFLGILLGLNLCHPSFVNDPFGCSIFLEIYEMSVAQAGSQNNTSDSERKSETDIVIETRNLGKVYRDFWGRKKVQALKSLDIEVKRGEVFGLLGPNGSGKSTTIKLLLGLLFPTNGRAFVFGKEASDVSKNERIGYLPEESYLYKFLNAEETLDFYGRLFDMPADVRRQRARTLIEMVGLQRARRRQLKEYSKGMTRRIGLAQALINEPELLVLDEPTTGLDPIGSREMKDLILRLRDQGKTILMCSHQLADVQDVCDRIAILYQGELKELGRVDSLLKVQDVTEIHTKALSEDAKREIQEVLRKHGSEIIQMDNPTMTMEELFLDKIRESEARPGMKSGS
jgi:ABC-2 type transport system ATP-binding protein